jgi:hypothetical protein
MRPFIYTLEKTFENLREVAPEILDLLISISKGLNTYIPLTPDPEGVAEASQSFLRDTFYQNDLAMMNTPDVAGGKPIAVWLQSISGGDAVQHLYDTHGRKREVLFFCSVPDTTRDSKVLNNTEKLDYETTKPRKKYNNKNTIGDSFLILSMGLIS